VCLLTQRVGRVHLITQWVLQGRKEKEDQGSKMHSVTGIGREVDGWIAVKDAFQVVSGCVVGLEHVALLLGH
jgi:hypothetical protein